MNLYKLVIFDLDGVLVDACEWHRVAFNSSLKEICNYEISLEDHHSEFNGIPTKKKLQKLESMGIINSENFSDIYSLKQKNTLRLIEDNAKIRPEKIEMIRWLKSQDIKVACFTNSIRDTAMLMLSKTGIVDLFDSILTNQDVKNPKPDPEGYILTLSKFNASPEETLIVEDSPKGVTAAIKSGCQVVVVRSPEDVNITLFTRSII